MERVQIAFFVYFRYLALMRSRDAEKNFYEWGSETITSKDQMKPIVYDEITTLAHAEFRLAKEYS